MVKALGFALPLPFLVVGEVVPPVTPSGARRSGLPGASAVGLPVRCVRRAHAVESDSKAAAARWIRTGREGQELCDPLVGLGGRAVATPRGG